MKRIKTVNLSILSGLVKLFYNSEQTVMMRIKAVLIKFNLFHFQLSFQLMISMNLFPFCKA